MPLGRTCDSTILCRAAAKFVIWGPYRLLNEMPAKLAANPAFAKQTVTGSLLCFRFGLCPKFSSPIQPPEGLVAEWLRRGLQILAPQFDSGRGLQISYSFSSRGVP